MIKEYKYGTFLKILGIICALILLLFSIAVFFIPNSEKEAAFNLDYILIPIAIIFFPLSILAIRDVLVSKVIITDSFISSKTAVSFRELRVEEISGFKRGDNYIYVYPSKRSFKKKLKFSKFLFNVHEIENWLYSHSKNFDFQEQEKEIDDFYKKSEYGFSDTEKVNKLQKATKTAKFVNTISILFTIAAIFLKEYKLISTVVLISIPILIIGIVFYFKGLIKFGDKEEDETTIYPSVFWGLASPIFLLFFSVFLRINIFDYENVWLPLISLSLTIFILCIALSKEYIIKNIKSYGKIVLLFVVIAMYSYAILIWINVFFDKNGEKIYKGIIEKKTISKNKYSDTYNLTLHIDDLNIKSEKFKVSSEIYKKVEIKEPVKLILNQGALKIPFYNIKCYDNN